MEDAPDHVPNIGIFKIQYVIDGPLEIFIIVKPRVYLGILFTCVTVNLDQWPPTWWGLRGWKFLILITLDCWKRYFQERNYIENYFYLLKSTKTTSQIFWRNIIWADFFGYPFCTNGIKASLGLPLTMNILLLISESYLGLAEKIWKTCNSANKYCLTF